MLRGPRGPRLACLALLRRAPPDRAMPDRERQNPNTRMSFTASAIGILSTACSHRQCRPNGNHNGSDRTSPCFAIPRRPGLACRALSRPATPNGAVLNRAPLCGASPCSAIRGRAVPSWATPTAPSPIAPCPGGHHHATRGL